MQGLAQENKHPALIRKSDSCSKGILTQNLSVTLPALSTLNEMDCKPFWNRQTTERATTKSVPLKGAKIIASKKIRFYPENESAYRDALALYRRSYNLAVDRFRNDKYKDENGKFINMRPSIKLQVEQEQKANGRAYNSLISDNGTLAAAATFKAVCSKNKKLKQKGAKEGFAEISFKSRKGSKHSFSIDRLPKGLNPCVNALGKIHLTEEAPSEAIGKSFDRKINRLKCKKDDIILDLHNRLAFELVSRYDVIFLPTFETRGNQGKPGEW